MFPLNRSLPPLPRQTAAKLTGLRGEWGCLIGVVQRPNRHVVSPASELLLKKDGRKRLVRILSGVPDPFTVRGWAHRNYFFGG